MIPQSLSEIATSNRFFLGYFPDVSFLPGMAECLLLARVSYSIDPIFTALVLAERIRL